MLTISARERARLIAAGLVLLLPQLPLSGLSLTRAQTIDLSADSRAYVARPWTTSGGLPHTSAWALEQGNTGARWVGSLDGLARFDGHSFTTFTPTTTKGLNGNRFHALHQASDGTLWIGTGSGLSIRRNGHFRAIETPNHVSSIAETQKGTIWVSGDHLYRSAADSARPSLQRIPLPDSLNRSHAVAAGGPDSIWVTVDSHLLLYRNGTFEEPYSLPTLANHEALGVATGPNGTVWVGAGPHVLSIRTNSSSARDAVTRLRHDGTQVRKIRVSPTGAAWITTIGDGLLRASDGELRRVRAGRALPSPGGPYPESTSGSDPEQRVVIPLCQRPPRRRSADGVDWGGQCGRPCLSPASPV